MQNNQNESKKPKKEKKIIKNLHDIDQLMDLVKKHKMDYVEIDGLKMTKSQHEFSLPGQTDKQNENSMWVDPYRA